MPILKDCCEAASIWTLGCSLLSYLLKKKKEEARDNKFERKKIDLVLMRSRVDIEVYWLYCFDFR